MKNNVTYFSDVCQRFHQLPKRGGQGGITPTEGQGNTWFPRGTVHTGTNLPEVSASGPAVTGGHVCVRRLRATLLPSGCC